MGPYLVLPFRARVDLGAMVMEEYSALPKVLALLEPHPQIVYCHIQVTCRQSLRCSWCILQPQDTITSTEIIITLLDFASLEIQNDPHVLVDSGRLFRAGDGDNEEKVFCCWKIALFNTIIVLTVSVLVSLKINRMHYFQSDSLTYATYKFFMTTPPSKWYPIVVVMWKKWSLFFLAPQLVPCITVLLVPPRTFPLR